MDICSTKECTNISVAKGLCKKHYNLFHNKIYYNKNKDRLVHKQYNRERSLFGQFTQLKRKAKVRGYLVSISFNDFKKLRNNKCHYCKEQLSPTGGGLDRKNNKLGYFLDNVIPCCGLCNRTKSDLLTYEEMMNLIEFRRIKKHQEDVNDF